MGTTSHVLPDVLPVGVCAVICGMAVGTKSRVLTAYYADPSNRFWGVLHQVGLTEDRLQPEDFRTLPKFGLGLTDIAKAVSGADSTLPPGALNVPAFMESIRRCRPKIVAFNGKAAARAFYGIPSHTQLDYGSGSVVPDFPHVFILPSTSGNAGRYWDLAWWQEFARRVAVERIGTIQ
jgi:TDG/mug DNA glycosylase family protein